LEEESESEMTDVQLYLVIGIPSFVAALGILTNGLLYNSLSAGLNARMSSLEARMLSLENTFTVRFDLLMGTRLSVIEDRNKR
jgi:hypothetical protein